MSLGTSAAAALPTRILSPAGILGYGIVVDDFWACIERGVDLIAVDAGSTDPGPYQLGLGATLVAEESFERDLRPLIQAVGRHGIPLHIGSAGGAGTRGQVDDMVALVDRIAAEEGYALKVAAIYADVPAELVSRQLADGRVKPNVRGELPTPDEIRACTAIVAQMGAEPFTALLESADPPDVIVAGRAYDPAPHAAWAMNCGARTGIAWHMGKILECGGACCEPKGGGVLATVYEDAFELTPMSPWQVATPLSVAAHTLYEKSRPDLLPGPAGVLDVRDCRYEALDDRTVRVTGSRHQDAQRPSVKLEGASIVGYRSVFIGGIRDPILIGQIDEFLARVRQAVSGAHPELADGRAQLHFHVYGADGVMGDLEPSPAPGHEIGVMGEVTAATQEKAKAIATITRVAVLHLNYPGQMATAGNLALPLSPMDNPIGPVCAFTVYHVMDAADGLEPVPPPRSARSAFVRKRRYERRHRTERPRAGDPQQRTPAPSRSPTT